MIDGRRAPIRICGAFLALAVLVSCKTVDATVDKVGDTADHAFDMPSNTEKGYAALAEGKNPIAIRWFTLALKDDPDNPYLKLDLAAAQVRLGRFDDARKLYQQVIDTAKDVVPEKASDPALQGKSLADIAAADMAKLPPPGSTPPAVTLPPPGTTPAESPKGSHKLAEPSTSPTSSAAPQQ
jgi:tetratricopeptide (TPR) repeat protein